MKRSLLPLALLALAALSPAPIKELKPGAIAERSQAQVLKEMRFAGAYKPVGRVPEKTQESTPLRDGAPTRDAGSVSSASSGIVHRDDGALVQVTAKLAEEKHRWRPPVWLLLGLAVGGALGVVRGLRAWADKVLPTPHRR